jgi:protein involved in plasmid replication-relaxation
MERHSAYKTEGTPTYTTAGTPRELDILKLLVRYDLLPSHFIYHALCNYQATRAALTKLAKGHYIGLPDLPHEEKLAYIPRNAFYVFELKPRGRALLARHGDIVTQGGNDHYKHRLLRSEIEFLLDRAPAPLSVKGPADILNHTNCPAATRALPYPFRVPPKPSLEPDITRGFGYTDNYLFLHVEVDRGTEPVLSLNARQSLKSKVARYVKYFRHKAYKTHFGFVVAPSVMFITTRAETDILQTLIKTDAGEWAKRFLFTTIPAKPLPTHQLFAPWQGIDGAFDLMEKLNVRPEEGRPRERVGENHQGRGG